MIRVFDGEDRVPAVEVSATAGQEVASAQAEISVLDAMQRAVSPERVRFIDQDDGMMVFRAIDGVDQYQAVELQMLGQRIVQRLEASADPIVRNVMTSNDRIGIT